MPNDDRTPLMLAVEHGHIDSVFLLVRNGSAVNACDVDGRTSLHRAVRWTSSFFLLGFVTVRRMCGISDSGRSAPVGRCIVT